MVEGQEEPGEGSGCYRVAISAHETVVVKRPEVDCMYCDVVEDGSIVMNTNMNVSMCSHVIVDLGASLSQIRGA